ncbi:MAG: S8 family serine peptidase [Bdellovibrionales bacterium]
MSSFPDSVEEFVEGYRSYAAEVKTLCPVQSYYSDSENLLSVTKIDQNKFSFEVLVGVRSASGRHPVDGPYELAVEYGEGGDKALTLKKQIGTFKGEAQFLIKTSNGKKDFVRILGRNGNESNGKRKVFWFSGVESQILIERDAVVSEASDIIPLQTIYGNYLEPLQDIKFKVGVIGSGIDYNHPGFADKVAFRRDFEEDLLKREVLLSRVYKDVYWTFESYLKDLDLLQGLNSVGFPTWMDQALGTARPIDRIIKRAYSPGETGNEDHETRVASRIIKDLEDVEVYFARRAMDSFYKFDPHVVVGNFYKHGVRLINMSFGSACGWDPVEEHEWGEVFKAYPDVVFVVSAGNAGLDTAETPFCPATYSTSYANVISVTALNNDGRLASYHGLSVNYGSIIDLANKADDLLVLYPYKRELVWENNPHGASSLAAAQVSKMILKAQSLGFTIEATKIKQQLIDASIYSSALMGVNKGSSYIEESVFLKYLENNK